nr:MAG TPA: hypothetical protein [Bacteriophage sp.]
MFLQKINVLKVAFDCFIPHFIYTFIIKCSKCRFFMLFYEKSSGKI